MIAHDYHGHWCRPSQVPLSGTGNEGEGMRRGSASTGRYKGVPEVRPGSVAGGWC